MKEEVRRFGGSGLVIHKKLGKNKMTQLRFKVSVSSFISRIIVLTYHLLVMKLIHALVKF